MITKLRQTVTEWLSRPITGKQKGAIFMTAALLIAGLAGASAFAPGVLAGDKGGTAKSTASQDCGCPTNDSDVNDIDITGDNNTININPADGGTGNGGDGGAGDGGAGDGGDGGAGDGGGGDGGDATGADLELDKTVDNDEITGGNDTVAGNATVQFTVQVTNTGPASASGVVVSDDSIQTELNDASGFVYVSDTESQGEYDPTTGTWTVGSLDSGETATLTIQAAVVGIDETVTNTAQVTASDQSDPDSTPGNDDASEDDQDSADVEILGVLDEPVTLPDIGHQPVVA